MRPRLPTIPEPTRVRGNLALVSRLSDIVRGCYADVIVQVVSATMGGRTQQPVLIVWDGSEWPKTSKRLLTLDEGETQQVIPPLPQLELKSKGRTYAIFSYDYDNQCVSPLKSGDWIYLQNLHCHYPKDAEYSSLIMHSNTRPRFIWRLDLPIHEGRFYEKQWRDAIERTKNVKLPFGMRLQQQLQAAHTAGHRRTPDALDRLLNLVKSGMIKEKIRVPKDKAGVEEFANAIRDSLKAVITTRRAAAAAAAPKLRSAAVVIPEPASAAAPSVQPAHVVKPRSPRAAVTSASSSGVNPVVASSASIRSATTDAAEATAGPSDNLRKRLASSKQDERSEGGEKKKPRSGLPAEEGPTRFLLMRARRAASVGAVIPETGAAAATPVQQVPAATIAAPGPTAAASSAWQPVPPVKRRSPRKVLPSASSSGVQPPVSTRGTTTASAADAADDVAGSSDNLRQRPAALKLGESSEGGEKRTARKPAMWNGLPTEEGPARFLLRRIKNRKDI